MQHLHVLMKRDRVGVACASSPSPLHSLTIRSSLPNYYPSGPQDSPLKGKLRLWRVVEAPYTVDEMLNRFVSRITNAASPTSWTSLESVAKDIVSAHFYKRVRHAKVLEQEVAGMESNQHYQNREHGPVVPL